MKKVLYKGDIDICPVEVTMQIVGGKYTLLIIRELLTGTKRFGEIKKMIPTISTKTLTERLIFLKKQGLVERKAYKTIPLKVEYSLTQNGETLGPLIDQLRSWGKSQLNLQ